EHGAGRVSAWEAPSRAVGQRVLVYGARACEMLFQQAHEQTPEAGCKHPNRGVQPPAAQQEVERDERRDDDRDVPIAQTRDGREDFEHLGADVHLQCLSELRVEARELLVRIDLIRELHEYGDSDERYGEACDRMNAEITPHR